MKRVRDDVAWFINKFDHKYANEPWKNAKDSLVRATLKDTGVNIQNIIMCYFPEEDKFIMV